MIDTTYCEYGVGIGCFVMASNLILGVGALVNLAISALVKKIFKSVGANVSNIRPSQKEIFARLILRLTPYTLAAGLTITAISGLAWIALHLYNKRTKGTQQQSTRELTS